MKLKSRYGIIVCIILTLLFIYFPMKLVNRLARTLQIKHFMVHNKDCSAETKDVEYPCVTVTPRVDLKFQVYTYRAEEDILISKAFLEGGYWDWIRVSTVLTQLENRRNVHFVDIGANIGAYTLAVAHALRRPVIAVEPSLNSINRLSRSVCAGFVDEVVTLLRAVISNTSQQSVRLALNDVNRGITVALEDTASCESTIKKIKCMNETTKTLTLDDLVDIVESKSVILKVDAEGSEPKIFNELTASRFFSELDVPLVFMEFEYFPLYYKEDPKSRQIVNDMLWFFHRRNYDVRHVDMKTRLHRKWELWPTDVVFVKRLTQFPFGFVH